MSSKADYVRRQGQTRSHECHWPGCAEQVPPAKWGCARHWFALPKPIRDRIWKAFRPGQERDYSPSDEYLEAAQQAQRWVAEHRASALTGPDVRALTILQPYAHLIALGMKVVENRTWLTRYRGPLLIHAGKSRAMLGDEDYARYPSMAFGAIVAVAKLVNALPYSALPPSIKAHEHAHGPMCLVLGDVRPLATPLRVLGAQGLWTPTADVVSAVEAQVGSLAA